jgi:Flp pilus assembly protein TadD
LRDYDNAIQCYEKALKIDPDDPSVWNNKGNVLEIMKEYEEAKKCFEKAVTLNPRYASAWNNLGDIYNKLARYNEAISCFEKAILWESSWKTLQKEIGYRDIVQISVGSIAYNGIGYALINRDKVEEAIRHFEIAIKLDPNNWMSWYNKGLYNAKIGNQIEAIRYYDEAIKKNPENSELHYSNVDILLLNISSAKSCMLHLLVLFL